MPTTKRPAKIPEMLIQPPASLVQHAWENPSTLPAFNVGNAERGQTHTEDLRSGRIEVLGVLLRCAKTSP
jgi:hypothetical protein